MMFSYRQQKMCLIKMLTGCYFSPAATLLAVGRENPGNTQATPDAASVFFIVAPLFVTERQIMVWCTLFSACRAAAVNVLHSGVHLATMSMVAQAGPSSGGPGSCVTGILTPVWAIASERENSCDSMFAIHRRLPSWLRPQPKNTQNPRSATRTPFLNSATTVGARLSVSKSFRSGYTSTISVLLRWLPHILFMPFPTSTMILRM
ncbi:ash family protein [Salmonella enterica subsp. enterica serovar Gaminara]|nr:ash family protein [Salmonella enterica subsp. enterica serovar Gaminara]EDV6950699.1 ash family protein [Salmonella enterica subsp. enterica serovar Gaminara]